MGIRVEGIVSELRGETNSDGMTLYYPVINYTTFDNELISRKYHIEHNPPKYNVGNKVVILYDPDKPHEIIIDGKIDF